MKRACLLLIAAALVSASGQKASGQTFLSLQTANTDADSGGLGLAIMEPLAVDPFGELGLAFVMLNFNLEGPITGATLQLGPGPGGVPLADLINDINDPAPVSSFAVPLGPLAVGVVLSGPELTGLLQSGVVFVNVKTEANPDGEIGGLVLWLTPLIEFLEGDTDGTPAAPPALPGVPQIPGLPSLPGLIPPLPGGLPFPF